MDKLKKKEFKTPILEKDIRRLRVGDIVFVTGTLFTARDAAHRRMVHYLKEMRQLPFRFDGLPLYHCGPLVRKVNGEWSVLAAGPTTSMRMEPFEDEVIRNLGVRLVIGKGGMGERTRKTLREFGAAYAVFTGGTAVLAAEHVKKVKQVEWLDLGVPEAVWVFEVEAFGPIVIGIDSDGNSLFEKVQLEAERRKAEIFKKFES